MLNYISHTTVKLLILTVAESELIKTELKWGIIRTYLTVLNMKYINVQLANLVISYKSLFA